MKNKIGIVNIARYTERVFFGLSIGRWGNAAQVKDSAALAEYIRLRRIEEQEAKAAKEGKTVASNGDLDTAGAGASMLDGSSAVTARKKLISPKAAALKAITDHLNETKDKLIGENRGIAQPSQFMRGVYTLKKELVDQAAEIVESATKKLNDELIPAFIAAWPEMKEQARTGKLLKGGLGPLFNDADYPEAEEAASRYKLQDSYLQIGISDKLSEELRKRKEAEFDAKISNALEASMEALRLGFAELIDHAAEKLTVAPGEKPKTFRDSLVGNLLDFIGTFKAKDFGDEALEDLVNKAKTILCPDGTPIAPEKLRKFASTRDAVANGFKEIQGVLDGMIVERKGRKIDLSDDAD